MQTERTKQGDQFVLTGMETTLASRTASVRQQMAETMEKRALALRMHDHQCADLLMEEWLRLNALLPKQPDLFSR